MPKTPAFTSARGRAKAEPISYEEEGEDGRSEDGGSSSADFVKMNVFGDWHGQLRDILNDSAHQGKIVFKDDVFVLPRPGTCPRAQGTSSI